ncbi:MAG: 2-amino-4-hydroxy-6-hydroxymethyldihydropteridine diphosphokinase [Prevotella sp.]|nr:2-amino-4-hydroxy-6-hydroxymethyldihydropteridine diphosphokinase [Prevotella sp.]
MISASHQVYLSLGSNMGDRHRLIAEAIRKIGEQIGAVVRQSALYETEPWGFSSPNKFLNAAVCVETPLCPRCLLSRTQRIEYELGRRKKTRNVVVDDSSASASHCSVFSGKVHPDYHDRPIDIDILLYDNEIIDEPDLKIPHPLMHEREFVMKPLNEIMKE